MVYVSVTRGEAPHRGSRFSTARYSSSGEATLPRIAEAAATAGLAR